MSGQGVGRGRPGGAMVGWLMGVVAAMVLAGCVTESDSTTESQTPRITEAAEPGASRELLLTEADVRAAG